jgi:hypothetical protein
LVAIKGGAKRVAQRKGKPWFLQREIKAPFKAVREE